MENALLDLGEEGINYNNNTNKRLLNPTMDSETSI